MHDAPTRRPGEAIFTLLLALASIGLFIKAYGISGLEALSSPGALPMAATGTMSLTAIYIAWKAFRAKPNGSETMKRHILPPAVVAGIIAIMGYALLLQPLGFILTSFLFLAGLIKMLSARSLFFCAWVAALNVLIIYLVFRVVFSVLMPEGIVPEREILAWIGRLFGGAR